MCVGGDLGMGCSCVAFVKGHVHGAAFSLQGDREDRLLGM